MADPSAVLAVADLGARSQRRAISTQAGKFSGLPRSILVLLALLGREAPAGLLTAATSVDEQEVLESLGTLADADLVRQRRQGWGLVHDAVGEVLVSELTTADRVRWQARLAAVLDSAHGDVAERARLWREAGDRERAATAYAEAARRAVESCADDEAERLATAGLALVARSKELVATAVHAAARREAWPGSTRATWRVPEAISQTRSGMPGPAPARASILAQLAALDSGADDMRRAAEVAELALIEAGGDDRGPSVPYWRSPPSST